MSVNYGKKFEERVKLDFVEVEGASIDRLRDCKNRFKSIKNVSDFIGYIYPYIFYLECKSTLGNTLNFHQIRQYDDLVKKIGLKGVMPGVLIWFIEHQKVVWCNIETIVKMKEDGYKSVNVNNDLWIDGIYIIPSVTLRLYEKCDFRKLVEIGDIKFKSCI